MLPQITTLKKNADGKEEKQKEAMTGGVEGIVIPPLRSLQSS
jgi:hypothetical protein